MQETTGPQRIGESIKAISPSESKRSTPTKGEREKRLDIAFEDFVTRLRSQRQGWAPIWTAGLRAEMWVQFASECRRLLHSSGVPSPDRHWDLEAIRPEMPAGYRTMGSRLLKMISIPVTLAIGGKRGTGKSTLAWGLVIKFCDAGRPALYRTVAEMFNELSDAPWEEKQRIRQSYILPDLLVIDEIQVRDSGREWQNNELTTLIDHRYREERATLLISNLPPDELKENLGDSIWRRLIETGGQPIPTEWPRIEEHLETLQKNKSKRDVA